MAMDLVKGSLNTKTGLVVSPKGRMYYPSLLTKSLPKGEKDPSKAKYKVAIFLPKSADLTLLKNELNRAIVDFFGQPPAGGYKFKIKNWGMSKTEDNPRLAELADEFPVMLSAKADRKPPVLHANMRPCEDEDEIYGGRWAVISVGAFAYKHETGGPGVSFSLNHVMLLDNADPIGAGRVAAEDVFEAVGEVEGAAASASALFD